MHNASPRAVQFHPPTAAGETLDQGVPGRPHVLSGRHLARVEVGAALALGMHRARQLTMASDMRSRLINLDGYDLTIIRKLTVVMSIMGVRVYHTSAGWIRRQRKRKGVCAFFAAPPVGLIFV